jgi:hypothetical protein
VPETETSVPEESDNTFLTAADPTMLEASADAEEIAEEIAAAEDPPATAAEPTSKGKEKAGALPL